MRCTQEELKQTLAGVPPATLDVLRDVVHGYVRSVLDHMMQCVRHIARARPSRLTHSRAQTRRAGRHCTEAHQQPARCGAGLHRLRSHRADACVRADRPLREFRSTLITMLDTYTYELNILRAANQCVARAGRPAAAAAAGVPLRVPRARAAFWSRTHSPRCPRRIGGAHAPSTNTAMPAVGLARLGVVASV